MGRELSHSEGSRAGFYPLCQSVVERRVGSITPQGHTSVKGKSQEKGIAFAAVAGHLHWPEKGDLGRAPIESISRVLSKILQDTQTYHGMGLATWGVKRMKRWNLGETKVMIFRAL